MSKERRLSRLGRFLRPVFFIAILTVIAGSSFTLGQTPPALARVFSVGIVDPASSGFRDNDFDLFDAEIFPLTPSDGIVGNTGLNVDTYFAPVNGTVWIGLSVEEGAGPLTVDSDDYGTFIEALCNDNNGDNLDFRVPSDRCVSTDGMGTDRLVIPDAGNSLDHQPLGVLPRMGVGVQFKCQASSGVAHVTIGQDSFTFEFFIVCHGPLATTQLSATATQLEIWPQIGSTAHSLIRLQLFDAAGGIVAGYEVEWSIDRCGIETEAVNGLTASGFDLTEVFEVLAGAVPLAETVGPDSTPQVDVARNLVYDFNGDGRLEAISLAIVHCEPGHSPTNTPGPITVTARITKSDEAPKIVSFTLNLIGPPAQIFLQAVPTTVQCGEKVTVKAAVADALGQPVSDNTPIEFVVNLGGTGTVARLLGPVAPISSGVGHTIGGLAQFFLLTSTANVGAYNIVATSEGIFSTPPVTAFTSITCFVPPSPTAPPPAAAATAVSPAAAAPAIRPPNTGEAGLLR